MPDLSQAQLLDAYRAAGEETRLRILWLLSEMELTVTDLVGLLGQSQPRVSRHVRVLADAGLLARHREGSWTMLSLAEKGPIEVIRPGLDAVPADARQRRADHEALLRLRAERQREMQAYFDAHAASWSEERKLYIDEKVVEGAMLDMAGPGPFDLLVDLGTGTGRILEVFAGRVAAGIGIDTNADMLGYARSRLSQAGLRHLQVRLGDLRQQSELRGRADLVVMHQVLHFLSAPAEAIRAAAALLSATGRLLVVDFAPHEREELRENSRHVRLGIDHGQMRRWLDEAGLALSEHRLLPPDGSDQKLTVSVWRAEPRPAAA